MAATAAPMAYSLTMPYTMRASWMGNPCWRRVPSALFIPSPVRSAAMAPSMNCLSSPGSAMNAERLYMAHSYSQTAQC